VKARERRRYHLARVLLVSRRHVEWIPFKKIINESACQELGEG